MWKWIVCVLLGATALAAFVFLGIFFDWNKGEWASWVQAIGSIGAIAATALVAAGSYRKAVADQVSGAVSKCRERDLTIGRIFGDSLPIFTRVANIEREMSPSQETGRPIDSAMLTYLAYKSDALTGLPRDLFAIETYIAALQSVKIAELGNSEAASAMISGVFGLQTLATHLRRMRDSFDAAGTFPGFVFNGVNECFEAANSAAALFKKIGSGKQSVASLNG